MREENDYIPMEETPIVKFMETVTYADIVDWQLYLESIGHDVTRAPFVQVLRDAYSSDAYL